MKATKKSRSQSMGYWKGISCNTLSKAGNNFAFPFGINFKLAPSPQFNSALINYLQLFAPAQAAVFGLAQLEAQLVLHQLANIAVRDHSSLWNPLHPSILHTYQPQNAVSISQPPRTASCPPNKTSHANSNPATEMVCHQMSAGICPSVSTEELETANAKRKIRMKGSQLWNGLPQEQMINSHLTNDTNKQLDLHEGLHATSGCNHPVVSQTTQTVMSSAKTQDIQHHTFTRTAPFTAASRHTSGEVFEYGHSRSECKKSPRSSGHPKKNSQIWGLKDNSRRGWHDHPSPSHQSVSPSPSWSPSPPPLTHTGCAQSPCSFDRYSPSDFVYECSSAELRSSNRTRKYSGGHQFLPSSFTSHKYSQKRKKLHVASPNMRRYSKGRMNFSSFSVGHMSQPTYPSTKLLRKDDCRASTSTSNSSLKTKFKKQTFKLKPAYNVQQRTKKFIKEENDPWVHLGLSVMPQSAKSLNAVHLLYLSGIPAEAKYQDVCRCLAPFGVIKELVFLPDMEKLSQVLGLLYMLRAEDAEVLYKCKNLIICNKVFTITSHQEHKSDKHTNRKVHLQQPDVLKKSLDRSMTTTPELKEKKYVVCISGISFDCSEDDIIQLVTPFGQHIKIIIATEVDVVNGLDLKKALVVFSNEHAAMNIVKVYSVVPLHLRQYAVTLVPQTPDFSSPVSLFQAFSSPKDPVGSFTPGDHLLVVSNVPDQPHVATEVLQLVQPFSKVLRALVFPDERATDENASDGQNAHCIWMIFEMESSVDVSLACEWSQKHSCIFHDHHICFSMGTEPLTAKSEGIASSKSSKEPALEEDQGVKYHDINPSIHESEVGLVFISGFPENMDSEEDFIQMAAPHGVPTTVIIAAAQRKALVELPDKHSAQKMVAAYSAIPIGLKQLDIKFLPNTIEIKNPASLFQVIMGTEHPGGDSTYLYLLLTVCNVPDTVSGISQVQKLVQSYGAVNHTLILNNNMVIFEMKTTKAAKFAYEQLKKLPCTIHGNTLSFFWGSDLNTETTQENTEGAILDTDTSDFVIVDEVGDVTEFQTDDIPTMFKSILPDQRAATSSTCGAQTIHHDPFSLRKGRQFHNKTKDRDEHRKNGEGGKKVKEHQDGTVRNVQFTSLKSSGSQVKAGNEVKVKNKNNPQCLQHRKEKKLVQKAKTFIKNSPVFPEGYRLLPFNPECPVGMKFLEPKQSFFCKVCWKFVVGDEEVKVFHCRSFKHYKNLERWLQKKRCSELDKLGI